jgi:hypothetical protein
LGTFNTGNYNVTASQLSSTNFTSRTVNLGSSTITLSTFSSGAINFTLIDGGMVLNAGTSQINFTNSSAGITTSGGALTFYNVAFTSTSAGTRSITGSSTFNNLAITAPAAGVATITFNAQQTINGTLSTTGTAGNRRVFFASATYGISVDLVVNSAPSLTDADFRGLYVRGTAAPISGTRIGNRGECRGITFSTPKTVYWNLAGVRGWAENGWAITSGGSPSTDYFPLPQDTGVVNNASAITTLTTDSAIPYVGNVDFSARTTAFTFSLAPISITCYGNWTNGSGVTYLSSNVITFSGGGTQTITSAGRTFSCPITVDTYGGTVQLADALNIGTNTLTVTNGTFTTNGYTVTAGAISSSNSNVRTINLGASSVALSLSSGLVFNTVTNLTFNAGSSQITISVNTSGTSTVNFGGLTYNNLTFTNASSSTLTVTISGQNTFANLTLAGTSASANIQIFSFLADQIITGTLTCAGASAVQRVFLRSDTLGIQRRLTVNAISATDCDFRDINLDGNASGATPTRAGNCGGNSGINFSTKTVYWNLAGAQNWSATGWADSSGGTPAINNFPLAQDTAVFDEAGAAGTVTLTVAAWNIGTFDASNRSSAMTFSAGAPNPTVYGDWKFGTGVTSSSATGTITFSKNGTQTITSNGVQFGCPITINHPSGTVQLADALSLGATRTLTVTTGTFNAVTYNVTAGLFTLSGTATRTIRMGSGTWTASGVGAVWSVVNNTNLTLVAGTSNIVLSDTSTSARTFDGGTCYYNKLTIGGTTGTSTTTIIGNNIFGELASTKTVAHTILFGGASTQTIGKISVAGTAGNLVTIAGVGNATWNLIIPGPANSGADYLSIAQCAVSTTSPGEFYAGVNSFETFVGSNSGPIFYANTPTPRTLYWVGGTGNWSSTAKWSTSSGGGSGAAIPTSVDAVIFNSASNATAYTATIDAGVAIARCASFTMAGPASGNVTFAGTVPIAFHGNVSFAATRITRTYTGEMNWAGNSSYTFTTNGLTLGSNCTVNGIGSTWTLGFNTDVGFSSAFTVTYGSFSTSASNYSLAALSFVSNSSNVRTINLNGSTLTLGSSIPVTFATSTNLTFTAGTSTITMDASSPSFNGGGQTFYNVTFNNPTSLSATINGANTFNNLTFTGRTSVGISSASFTANQIINGTLSVSAGSGGAFRTLLASNTLGTPRTLDCAAVSLTDVDFRDITIAGAAAPASGTRLGDCKGNTGITFDAGINKYWTLQAGGNWNATAWTSVYSPLSPFGDTYPGSMQFNGSNQYLHFSNNAAFNFDSADFTIECWVNLISVSYVNSLGGRVAQILSNAVGFSGNGWNVQIIGNASGVPTSIEFNSRQGSSQVTVTASVTMPNSTWHHVAVVRAGTVTSIYLNGVSVGSGTLSNQTITSAESLWIGGQNITGYQHWLNGYISNLRVVKGTALYTSNFTPSTTPLTAVSGTSLLLRGTNPLQDISTNNLQLNVIGGAAINSFPLAQDTALFQANTTTLANASTVTVNANYNIGTIDMQARTTSSNTMILATGSTTPTIYGNWINGTGTTLSGTGRITYAGRGAQTIRSEGKTFTQPTTINSLGGSVTLQDAWVTNSGTTNDNPQILAGTFDANGYNVTNAGTATFSPFSSTGALARTIAIGSGTWTFAGTGTMWSVSGSNVTVTGTGTISLTGTGSTKTFTGGGLSYSGITLNQGGSGTLIINNNNTFKTITNSYSATGATTISLGGTTQTLTSPWAATGASGRVLTISGTSAGSPATLIYTGSGSATDSSVNYLNISNVRGYDLTNEWYAGTNSTNSGSLGWYFEFAALASTILGNFFMFF